MPQSKARAIGINHVALEVGDIDEALEFYGRLFSFTLRGRSSDAAFIDHTDNAALEQLWDALYDAARPAMDDPLL